MTRMGLMAWLRLIHRSGEGVRVGVDPFVELRRLVGVTVKEGDR